MGGSPGFALKLRNLDIEAKATEFLKFATNTWLNDNGWVLPTYLVSQSWGWVSWHIPAPCQSVEDVETYFYRMGVFSAFATALSVTDMNAENIIASGPSPIVIDLETVLHHQLKKSGPAWGPLSTGLYPVAPKYWGTDLLSEESGILGAFPVRGREIGQPAVADKAFVYFEGKVQNPAHFSENIKSGFRDLSQVFIENRQELQNFIDKCSNNATRCILRDTAGYQTIIEQSYHPVLLADRAKRHSYILECLTYAKGDLGKLPLITAELGACMVGDVPRFESTPSSGVLLSHYHAGALFLPNMRTALELVNAYLAKLDKEYIELETSRLGEFFDQLSLLSRTHADPSNIPAQRSADSSVHLEELDFKLAALAREIIAHESEIFTFRKNSYIGFVYSRVGIDLFSGTSGLLCLMDDMDDAILCKNEKDKVSDLICRFIYTELRGTTLIGGAYVGLASAIVPLFLQTERIDTDIFEKTIDSIYRRIKSGVHDRSDFLGTDLVGGLSGALAGVSLAWTMSKQLKWRDLARELCTTLIATSRLIGGIRYFPSADGLSLHEHGTLSGLSHGQSGIAYALALYAAVVDTSSLNDLRPVIEETLAFEVTTYDPVKKLWPDYRAGVPDDHGFACSWAYGLPGIQLAASFIESVIGRSQINDLLETLPFEMLVKDALAAQAEVNDHSISSGLHGTLFIAQRYLSTPSFWHLLTTLETTGALTRKQPDFLPGLMTSTAGQRHSYRLLTCKDQKMFPLLPHELASFAVSSAILPQPRLGIIHVPKV